MTITQDNICWHELVGLDVVVAGAPNRQMNGLNGRVIDETKSMIVVDVPDRGPKMIPKAGAQFNFSSGPDSEVMQVSGNHILKRPFERI